jgi:hypothetical protein
MPSSVLHGRSIICLRGCSLQPSIIQKWSKSLLRFWELVTSAAELMLGCSPSDTSRTELVGELVTEFQKVEGRRS